MKRFTLKGGYIVQMRRDKSYNAIDSNFLTTNTYYLQSLYGGFDRSYISTILKYSQNGQFLRFPYSLPAGSESIHWNDPRTVSRDNSIGCLIALSELCGADGVKECRSFAWNMIKRLSFFQNTHDVKLNKKLLPDFCTPGTWGIILRSTKLFTSRLWLPMYLVLDSFYTLTLISFIIKCRRDNNYNSPLYHMVSSVYFMDAAHWNVVSNFNKWLLLNKVPMNKNYPGIDSIWSQLREYSRMDYDPPIYHVYEQINRSFQVNDRLEPEPIDIDDMTAEEIDKWIMENNNE